MLALDMNHWIVLFYYEDIRITESGCYESLLIEIEK